MRPVRWMARAAMTALDQLRRAAHRDAHDSHGAFASTTEQRRRDDALTKAALAYAASQGWRAP